MDDKNPLKDNRKCLMMLITALAVMLLFLIWLMKPLPVWQLN